MSTLQTTSSLGRTRSLRAPPSAKVTTTLTANIPTCTSNVVLFLTNLRLLDLDLEPDWPDITATTFSSKDAAGGQKKRIQCVEWALYQLFSMWDAAETLNKLRPFYPPADQVQSINLRAALVRSLEQAKKAGVLGRDVLIRKTMLDECKGERLEEVLAVFSSAVLKKLVAERALNGGSEYKPTISERLSLENWGYSGNRTELNALLLAHKASIRSTLNAKNAARHRYRDFERLLATKERDVAQRRQLLKADARYSTLEISDTAKAEVRRILRNNWTGNEQWLDGLLFNETQSRRNGLLGNPFDEVWAGVQEGRLSDLEDQSAGLLEQLEQRVHHQKTRLQKWEDFRKKSFGDQKSRVIPQTPKKKGKKGFGIDFNAELDHTSDAEEILKYETFDSPPGEYATLLNGLQTDLNGLHKETITSFSTLLSSVKRVLTTGASQFMPPPDPVSDPISDLSEWEDEPEEQSAPLEIRKPSAPSNSRQSSIPGASISSRRLLPRPKSFREERRTSPTRHSKIRELPREHRRSRAEPSNEPPQSLVEPARLRQEEPIAHYRLPSPKPSALTGRLEDARSPSPIPELEDPRPPPPQPVSPTQAQADEILASMNNTSPSPSKKSRYTLSLAERTRMSMTRTSTLDLEDESHLSPIKTSHLQSIGETGTDKGLEQGEEYEDLISRTRRSMAGFEAARQKAQIERRRSQRRSKVAQRKDSYFPKVEEEGLGNGDVSVVEELIEAGEEEAIFKSRPRIATSPAPNSSKQWDEK
ncbi:hypothetical protein F5Y16DRAFT_203433 [Xylariaceae sp. FL0255]|nr:hypothetical protein F5Y16DRAFT_203433 [Xylariaceae sp. FL0255]